MKREFNVAGLFVLGCSFCLYSLDVPVTTNTDSGPGSLRQAIMDINSGSDDSNTIQMQIPGNSPISLSSDLPVIKKNTEIVSTGQQPINGQGQYRLFATIMADLSLTNCVLQNGAAIGGSSISGRGGGGMGAGGGVYIDRGNTLVLTNTNLTNNKSVGGQGGTDQNNNRGGGASFSTRDKNSTSESAGGGDYPGLRTGQGGVSDGSSFLIGYGGGDGYQGQSKGGGDGQGGNGSKGTLANGGYCGGGGGGNKSGDSGGGGGNGGGNGVSGGGGGGFGSGGASYGGGGFGGGGGFSGGGGFGGGGGVGNSTNKGKGGHFGGDALGNRTSPSLDGGGGAGLGGAIFVGDTATCIIQDNVTISDNKAQGGQGGNPGQGYAPDLFLFRKAKVVFNNQQPLNAPYSIMADQMAPAGHLDSGIVKQGPGKLTLSSPDNNYRGGTSIEQGTLAYNNPKALGSASITLNGGALQPTSSGALSNPINLQGGAINTPAGVDLTVSGLISGNTLIKTGAGKLTPTNTANNYQGGTTIRGGTLSLSDPQILGSSSGNITLDGGTFQPIKTMTLANPITADSGGILDVPKGTTLTTTGSVTGTGPINKTSPGTWIQQGNSSHSGPLNLNQGSLQNQGSLASQITIAPNTQLTNNGTLSGELTNNGTTTNNGTISGPITNNNLLTSNRTINGDVQNNGTINATGTLGGNVTNNGTLKPGSDDLGTLTVGGNYTQTPNGLLQLQMKPNNLSDHFLIQGTAQLDGSVDLELEPGIYQKNQKYNLIQADGGIEGFFHQISTNSKVQGIFQITPNNFNLIFDNPQIILPIPTDQLPNNQKNLSNYLFCDNFPFDDDRLVNLLQNLFSLSPTNYTKALATLTPEHYGALPIGESRAIHYLLTQNIPTCTLDCPNTKHTLTATPLYFRNDIQKNEFLPNYIQNSGGVRVSYDTTYITPFQSSASISYIHTHTHWGNHRGKADSNAVYLDLGMAYSIKGFLASLALLGGYSHTDATHNLFIGYPIKATSSPHNWDIAESLSLQYTHIYRSISIIPRIVLTQTNIYLSSICENKPKSLNLQTDAKYFGFLDTLISLRMQAQNSHCYCCVKPYVDLGWHNSSHLSNRHFHSTLDNFTACACSFSTKTYSGSTNRFFMEGGIAFSFMNNIDLLLNSRIEMAKDDLLQAVNFGASWRF